MKTSSETLSSLVHSFAQSGTEQDLERFLEWSASRDIQVVLEGLYELISDPFSSPQVRLAILQICSHIPEPSTTELFIRELRSSSLQVQELAIYTLGCWKVRKAVPYLARRLRTHHSTVHARRLIEALARIASDDALLIIQQWLQVDDLIVLKQRLDWISLIPQSSLIQVLKTTLEWVIPEAIPLVEQTLRDVEYRLEETVQKRLSTFQMQMEEGLF